MKARFLKTLTATGIILSLSLTIFSGCGTKNTEGNSSTSATTVAEATTAAEPTPSAEPAKEVKLTIISQRVEDKVFNDDLNARFQEKYPNIKLQFDAVPTKDYDTLRTARLTAGDVDIYVGGNIKDEKDRNQMADITGQPFLADYYPGALKMLQWEGKQYGLPLSTVAVNVFYNKKIFSDLGLSIPTTWTEFIAACDKIKAAKIDPIMFGGKDQWPINMVIIGLETPIVTAAEPDFYAKMRTEETKFTDPGWVEIYKKLEVLSKYFEKNAMGVGYGQAPGLFAQGKAAMMIDGSWSATQVEEAKPEFEVGAFLLPATENKDYNSIAPTKLSMAYHVYANSPEDRKDAAYKYLAFFSEKENYQKYTDVVKMFPVISGIKMTSPLAQEISDLTVKQAEMWENLMIPGAKYDYTNHALQVVMRKLTPDKAAEKMQADLIGSKANWK